MKILVVGLGYTGLPLAGALARYGHEVHALRRTTLDAPSFLHLHTGDATDAATLVRLGADFDQVLVLLSAGERSEAAYERTYLGGAVAVRAAFPSARLVWVSSTAVYDAAGDALIDDDTRPSAPTGTSAVLLRAEATAASGPHLIVRPSGIYGPQRTTLLRRLVRSDLTPAEHATWTNRIHRDDLVRALAFCVERPELSGTLLVSDQEPARLGDMQEWVQAELTRCGVQADAPARGGVPPVADAAAPTHADAAPRPPASPRAEARKSRRILASRLTALGFSWRYPTYREGYAGLLPKDR